MSSHGKPAERGVLDRYFTSSTLGRNAQYMTQQRYVGGPIGYKIFIIGKTAQIHYLPPEWALNGPWLYQNDHNQGKRLLREDP